MYRNPSDREVAKNPKQPVSVNRLKKVVSANIESIRILSEILWEPHKISRSSGERNCFTHVATLGAA